MYNYQLYEELLNKRRGDLLMKKFLNWFSNEESGQGMVEYALIIALVAIVVIVALRALGTATNAKMQNVADNLK